MGAGPQAGGVTPRQDRGHAQVVPREARPDHRAREPRGVHPRRRLRQPDTPRFGPERRRCDRGNRRGRSKRGSRRDRARHRPRRPLLRQRRTAVLQGWSSIDHDGAHRRQARGRDRKVRPRVLVRPRRLRPTPGVQPFRVVRVQQPSARVSSLALLFPSGYRAYWAPEPRGPHGRLATPPRPRGELPFPRRAVLRVRPGG